MKVKNEWKKKGFIEEPMEEGLDLKAEIRKIAKEKDAVILAHYYTRGEIQEVADFIGDSLALARKAAETDALVRLLRQMQKLSLWQVFTLWPKPVRFSRQRNWFFVRT